MSKEYQKQNPEPINSGDSKCSCCEVWPGQYHHPACRCRQQEETADIEKSTESAKGA